MKKPLKIALITIISIVVFLLLVVLGYYLYLEFTYSRYEDNLEVVINNSLNEEKISSNKEFSIVTYNAGFGAYDQDYSFFMDEGIMEDGKLVKGKYGKAVSKDRVVNNITGIISEVEKLDADFIFFQEVDVKATRSYKVNQLEMIESSFPSYSSMFTENFHSAYLFYPFLDPHGKTTAGLLTLSKYNVDSATRRSYPLATNFSKFFDLDRCFLVSRIKLDNGKELVLINSHMSAYDEGGLIRKQQLELLSSVMVEEREKGNYVIVGGDFNHILGKDLIGAFDSKQKRPGWIAVLDNQDLPEGFSIVKSENATLVPTCRGADIPYTKGVNYTAVIDGFIISDNINATSININNEFMYSDHQPVIMNFTLK